MNPGERPSRQPRCTICGGPVQNENAGCRVQTLEEFSSVDSRGPCKPGAPSDGMGVTPGGWPALLGNVQDIKSCDERGPARRVTPELLAVG